jgi:hypothetical protein
MARRSTRYRKHDENKQRREEQCLGDPTGYRATHERTTPIRDRPPRSFPGSDGDQHYADDGDEAP